MTIESDANNTDLLAAQIALLVLRTHVSGVSRYLIPPSSNPIGRDEAVALLASLPKPVELELTRGNDVIEVTYRPLTGVESDTHHQDLARKLALWRSAIRQHAGVDPDSATLLIRGRLRPDDALRIPLEALTVWMRDYSMPHTMGGFWTNSPPGTHGVIEVSEPGEFTAEIWYDV